MLDKMLNTKYRKSGHSSALLNVNLTFQFLECAFSWLPDVGKCHSSIKTKCLRLRIKPSIFLIFF